MGWGIRTKLYASFGLFIGLLTAAAIALSVYSASVMDKFRHMNDETVSAMELANAERAMWSLRFGIANYPGADEKGRAKIMGEEQGWYDELRRALNAYGTVKGSETEAQALDKLNAVVAKYIASRPKWFELYNAGKLDEAKEWRAANTNKFGAETVQGLKELIALQKKHSDRAVTDIIDWMARVRTEVLAACAIVVLLTVGMAYSTVRGLMRQLGGEPAYAAAVANRIAGGDLTVPVEIHSKDRGSLLASIKAMQQQLTGVVQRIKGSSDAIASASTQIASGNADLSQRTEEQASSLEETASSMEELTGTVKQNAENAKQANQLAAGASAVAVKGGEVVQQVVHTMSSINESSKKIADIIGVIDGIAFQTNILALNAAVEAARAGEQGRGFAVVAAEVRTLAQRSAAAAKEIKQLITDSVGNVEAGTKLVDEAGKTMEEIVSSVKRVTDIMAEIAAASHEQTGGIEQVNQALTQMDHVTQQNAALVEEAAAAADSMREQAQDLTKAVAIFKLAATHDEPAAATTQPQEPRLERRGPNRARNVARLPAQQRKAEEPKAEPALSAEPAGTRKVANGATANDQWQEF